MFTKELFETANKLFAKDGCIDPDNDLLVYFYFKNVTTKTSTNDSRDYEGIEEEKIEINPHETFLVVDVYPSEQNENKQTHFIPYNDIIEFFIVKEL
jgi:hypothetical protein